MARGKLITIEGLDGAGKTTLAAGLLDHLRSRGHDARLLREPGGVAAAEAIRSVVKNPELHITARAEALLYAAARAQLVEEALEPLLADGVWVLLDRFVDSSLAYQGGGRRLGVEAIREVNALATGALTPDLTILVVVDPTVGRLRSQSRGQPPDRLELEDEEFFARIAAAYAELARSEPDRIHELDGSKPPAVVLDAARRLVDDLV
jgi:dTMP kinase